MPSSVSLSLEDYEPLFDPRDIRSQGRETLFDTGEVSRVMLSSFSQSLDKRFDPGFSVFQEKYTDYYNKNHQGNHVLESNNRQQCKKCTSKD